MTARERYVAVLSKRIPDSVPRYDGIWKQTLARWRREGMPPDAEPEVFFRWDPIFMLNTTSTLGLSIEVLEETEDWQIVRDADGVTEKQWKRVDSTPAQLDWLLKDPIDFRVYRSRLKPSLVGFDEQQRGAYCKAVRDGAFLVVVPTEPCWWLMRTYGFYRALSLMAEDPCFCQEVFEYITEQNVACLESLRQEGFVFDAAWYLSDLCYRNGMLFSPRFYRERLQPYHKRFADYIQGHDMFLMLHCDGDVREFVPHLIEAGFACIQPLEARCGNDVRELKREYGNDIVFWGNISTDAMARGGTDLEHEVLSKLCAAKPGGGYMYHSDHSIPPTVSFENYLQVMRLLDQRGDYAD